MRPEFDDDWGRRLVGHGLAHPEDACHGVVVRGDGDRDVTSVFGSNEDGFQDGIIYLSREVRVSLSNREFEEMNCTVEQLLVALIDLLVIQDAKLLVEGGSLVLL